MNPATAQMHTRMVHIVTAYDMAESRKKFYNRYALGLYLAAVQRAADDLYLCADDHFNGRRLCDALLTGLGFAPQTREERKGTL